MNYAVIKTGGKQYKVAEGDVITVERVATQPNDTITFSDVLLHIAGDQATFGQPTISGFTVTGKVLEHLRGEKIRVAKYKAKVRYRRVTGHRQELSKIQIESIGGHKARLDSSKLADKKVVAAKAADATTETPVKKSTRKSAQK